MIPTLTSDSLWHDYTLSARQSVDTCQEPACSPTASPTTASPTPPPTPSPMPWSPTLSPTPSPPRIQPAPLPPGTVRTRVWAGRLMPGYKAIKLVLCSTPVV